MNGGQNNVVLAACCTILLFTEFTALFLGESGGMPSGDKCQFCVPRELNMVPLVPIFHPLFSIFIKSVLNSCIYIDE